MNKIIKNGILIVFLLFIQIVFTLLAGCDINENVDSENQNTPMITENQTELHNEVIENNNDNEDGLGPSAKEYTILNDVKDYTIGMTFPIVDCKLKEINEEILKLDMVYEDSSEYRKNDDSDTISYISIERDGRGVRVMKYSAVSMRLLYIDYTSEIKNFFGTSLDHANDMISKLGYSEKVSLFYINNIPISYDNYTRNSNEPIYELEYAYSPKVNNLYFSCMPGGNRISIDCNNECAYEVIDSVSTDFENIGEVTVNYAYKEAVAAVEEYGFSKEDILYCIFVYSGVFTDSRTEYTPVWEFGFQGTVIQISAFSGEVYDYCPPRAGYYEGDGE